MLSAVVRVGPATLTPRRIHAALIPEQWFRVVQTPVPGEAGGERETGWLVVLQRRSEVTGTPGVEVEARWHILAPDRKSVDDSVGAYFASDDTRYEQWLVTTTRRTLLPDGREDPDSPPMTTQETGTRSGGTVEIKLEQTGKGAMPLTFAKPPSGYLPQAYVWLLPSILPADEPAGYGFYWYNATMRSMTYRHDRVEPALDRFTIHTRLSPTEEETESTYDATRATLERRLSPALKLLPSTNAELQRLWPGG